MSIRIVTDSTSDLPVDIINELDISIVPLNVHFGEDVFKDGVELNSKEFMARLVSGADMPSTSQPSVGEFLDVYREISLLDQTIVSLHISEKLSGTLNSARQGAAEIPGDGKIYIIDTELGSMGLGLVVIAAARAVKTGKSLEEVITITKSVASRCRMFFILDTLEYLERGGRIGRASALLGSLLRIKPILTINNGEVDSFGRARSRKSGILKIEEAVNALGPLEEISVVYNGDEKEAQELANRISSLHGLDGQPTLSQLGPVIGTHAGPNALGIAVVCRE